MVTPFFHALLLPVVLAAVVFTASSVRGRASIAVLGMGYLATLFAASERIPDPVWVGSAATAIAALQIFCPRYGLLTAFCTGALGGMCGALAQPLGIPLPVGTAFGAAVVAATAYLSLRKPEFAPQPLCEEALLGTLAFAVLVALLGGTLLGSG